MNPEQTPTRTDRAQLADEMRRAASSSQTGGAEYAIATGVIGAIVDPGRYGTYVGLSDAEKLAEIAEVLRALDEASAAGAR